MKVVIRVRINTGEWVVRVLERAQAEKAWQAILALGKAWGFVEAAYHERKMRPGNKPERVWRRGKERRNDKERLRGKNKENTIKGKVVAYADFFNQQGEYQLVELRRYTASGKGRRVVRYHWVTEKRESVGKRHASENPDKAFWYAKESKSFSNVRWVAGDRNAALGPSVRIIRGKRVTMWK